MARTTFVTKEPVVLEGFQAVLKPSQYGYSLSAVVDTEMMNKLESDRVETLKWAESKLKNPKRSVLRPEPWEEVAEGKYKVKFSWNEETKPPVVDTEGSPVVDNGTPLYSGSKVKLAFYQKPYILKDGVTYGTSLKLQGIQIVTLNGSAGVDTGDLSDDAVAELFGKTQGFKAGDPNVTVTRTEEVEDDF
jgi:hypothetical protein